MFNRLFAAKGPTLFQASRRALRLCCLAACVAWGGLSAAQALELKPYKENLFSYRSVTDSRFDGDFLVVDYSKQRDLRDRDEIDERKVYGRYVSYKPRRSQANYELKANGRTIKYIGVGKAKGGAKAVVIYLHGQGGNRFQGMNDESFGGNFNRIKNLMVRNGGAYLTTDFTDFGQTGTSEVAALIAEQKRVSPKAQIVVACGSMGGIICWNLVKDGRTAQMIDGIMLMGSPRDPGFLSSGILSRRVPVYMSQGSHDSVYNWEDQANFFTRVKSAAPGYPIKFHLFNTGSHGTPIRMTDWRLILNWIYAN